VTVTNGYATVAELREHFGDDRSQLPEEPLARAINATSRAIDRHCGRRFWQDSTVQVRTYRPDDTDIAWVDDISTTTGLIVETDTAGDYTWATTWTISTDFDLGPDNVDQGDTGAYAWNRLTAVGGERFPVHPLRKTLQVTARFGWSDIPDDVHYACLLKAAALFKRREAPFGVAGFNQFGPVRINREDRDLISLLFPYQRMTVRAV
jgi:hypothetical protein